MSRMIDIIEEAEDVLSSNDFFQFDDTHLDPFDYSTALPSVGESIYGGSVRPCNAQSIAIPMLSGISATNEPGGHDGAADAGAFLQGSSFCNGIKHGRQGRIVAGMDDALDSFIDNMIQEQQQQQQQGGRATKRLKLFHQKERETVAATSFEEDIAFFDAEPLMALDHLRNPDFKPNNVFFYLENDDTRFDAAPPAVTPRNNKGCGNTPAPFLSSISSGPEVKHQRQAKHEANQAKSSDKENTSVAGSTNSVSSETSGKAIRFRNYQADQWMERFDDLVQYKKEHGHCLVAHSYPPNQRLAQWVKRQRYQHKLKMLGRHSTLTDARQKELEDMGFVWDSHKAAWDERLEALKQYYARHGNCMVPTNYDEDKPLAVWVKCQRRQLKLYRQGRRSTMTEERFQLLEELNFEWNPRNL